MLFKSGSAVGLMIRAANLAFACIRQSMALSEADVPAGGEARRALQEPRLTSSHFSTRQRAPRCQADKVKHCGDPS